MALFRVERAAFARRFPRCGRAYLELTDAYSPTRELARVRDLAAAWPEADPPRVVLARRALAMGRATVAGLLRHELGHVADPWWDRPGAEQRADDLAELATGARIRYDRRKIQTTGPGTYPRPGSLHR